MRTHALALVLCLVSSVAFAAAPSATISPGSRATAIAEGSPWVEKHLQELKAEALKIRDPKLREATLGILATPRFELAARKSQEARIRGDLIRAGLLKAEDAPASLIPAYDAMPFVAAPGSTWNGHHSYPGGLVTHTLTNLKNALALARNWETVHGIRLDPDRVRAAPIWHDVAKTWTIRWQADGTSTKDEGKIAGTNTHHILGVAEALMRGFSPGFVVTLASAHSPPTPGAGLEPLLGFLRAACLIAGKPFESAGLTPDGSKLAHPAPMESFIDHLSDHDWVGSEVFSDEARQALVEAFPGEDAWKRDERLAQVGDFRVAQAWRIGGTRAVRSLFSR